MITHSLCTVEFETLRPAYNWLLEELDMKDRGSDAKGPMQREYGRLNVEGTILSKRRIAMLVEGCTVGGDAKDIADEVDDLRLAEEGEPEPEAPSEAAKAVTTASGTTKKTIPPAVSGWDDPRLFTLVALRRRGVPPGALKKFVLDLGVTKANANTMTHILDASIRTYLERSVPRLMIVLDPIKVTFTNLPEPAPSAPPPLSSSFCFLYPFCECNSAPPRLWRRRVATHRPRRPLHRSRRALPVKRAPAPRQVRGRR